MLTLLAEIQRTNGWSDAEMARRLGLSRSHWNLVRNGRVRLTHETAVKAAGAFPELTRALLDLAFVSVGTSTHTSSEAA